MKHIGALIGIAVVVFGATFLFTSEWPQDGQDDQVAQMSGEAVPPSVEEEQTTAEAPTDEGAGQPAQAEQEPAAQEAPATQAPATQEADDAAAGGEEIETAQTGTDTQEAPAGGQDAAGDAAGDADVEALMVAGEEVYSTVCAACHGAEGEGAVGPAFAGNTDLEDAEFVATIIIHGQGGMPPFGDQLDDDEVAAVATYIRNSWDNEFGPVTPEEAEAAR